MRTFDDFWYISCTLPAEEADLWLSDQGEYARMHDRLDDLFPACCNTSKG